VSCSLTGKQTKLRTRSRRVQIMHAVMSLAAGLGAPFDQSVCGRGNVDVIKNRRRCNELCFRGLAKAL
jgi:hypothetical protein